MSKEQDIIKVVIVEPLKKPYVKVIKNDLEPMQEIVGGYIECVPVYPENNGNPGLDIVLNEEGKINGKSKPNRLYADGEDVLFGTFFVTKSNEDGEFISLSDEECEEAINKYSEIEIFTIKGQDGFLGATAEELRVAVAEFGGFIMYELDANPILE
jgi:hypothetical protein